jgi:RimJ/RimL family protein N-acetyltransferase
VRAAQPLKSERLDLEPLRIDHAAEMVDVLADTALYGFIGGQPPSEADLVARYMRQVSHDDWLNWIVRERGSGRVVGTVQVTMTPGTAELAWVISTSAQGKGYATEATRAVVESLDADLLIAHIHPDHAASNAVARHLGLEPTAEVKNGEVRWQRTNRCHN